MDANDYRGLYRMVTSELQKFHTPKSQSDEDVRDARVLDYLFTAWKNAEAVAEELGWDDLQANDRADDAAAEYDYFQEMVFNEWEEKQVS